MSAIQMNATRGAMGHANGQLWLKAIMTTAVIIGFMLLLSNLATASDGAEFAASATQFETWVKGNLGKLAAFVALAVGAVVAAVKKDWSWFFGAIVLSMGVGIVCGIINASFTAIV